MAFLKERLNLFSGNFKVAPRPLVPDYWDAPEDHPSATRFWVDPTSGEMSWHQKAESWEPSLVLKHWHFRQATRLWACRQLIQKFGREEAQRRVSDLQLEVRSNVNAANAYLDLLVSITYEACLLTREASITERRLVNTAMTAKRTAESLNAASSVLTASVGGTAAEQAVAASRALDELLVTLANTARPMDTRFEPGNERVADRMPNKEVWKWVGYITPNRNYREPDLRWLMAAAVVIFRDSKPEFSAQKACERVGGYLNLLDAPFGRVDEAAGPQPDLTAAPIASAC